MKLIQDVSSRNITDWRKHQLYVNCGDKQYKISWDIHLPNGQRVHVLESPLDDIFVWRNAIVVGINHAEGINE